MNLTLEVINARNTALDAMPRKVFGPLGGTIGRALESDWVLANPCVSRHHATVRFLDGVFYIESNSPHGVGLNSPNALIPRGERRPLNEGDHLFIDEYEIAVRIAPRIPTGNLETYFFQDLEPIQARPEPPPDDFDPLQRPHAVDLTGSPQDISWNASTRMPVDPAAAKPSSVAPSRRTSQHDKLERVKKSRVPVDYGPVAAQPDPVDCCWTLDCRT